MVDIKKINGHGIEDTVARQQLNNIADYIIETGVQNDWTYEKWNSGKLILRNIVGKSDLSMSTNSMGTYWDTNMITDRVVCNLPIITQIDHVNGTMFSDSNYGHGSGIFLYNIAINNNNQISVIFRAHQAVTSNAGFACVEVIGKWK